MAKQFDMNGVIVNISKHRWSKRMTMRIKSGQVYVTIPLLATYSMGKLFVQQNYTWINSKITDNKSSWLPDDADYKKDKTKAKKLVEAKLSEWNYYYNYSWGRVAIRDQSTRWGSASTRGNLNFSWRLLYLPTELQDYIVVHEICHLKEPNHSSNFWDLVARTIPDYKNRRKYLKQFNLM